MRLLENYPFPYLQSWERGQKHDRSLSTQKILRLHSLVAGVAQNAENEGKNVAVAP